MVPRGDTSARERCPGPDAASVTLTQLVRTWALEDPNEVVTVLEPRGTNREPLTRGDLAAGAAAAAEALHTRDVGVGDRVLLLATTTRSFLAGLYGTYLVGAVAVPSPASKRGRGAERLARVVSTARPAVLLDTAEGDGDVQAAGVPVVTFDASPHLGAEAVRSVLDAAPAVDPESPALVQFTSGSTLAPRGAVISHRAVLENLAATSDRFSVAPREVGTNWCPLYHDMGMIGGVLWPLYTRLVNVLLPPERVVMSPLVWLRTLSETGSVITTTPNFAMALVNRRCHGPSAEFDLGNLRHIIIGGEPIAPDVTSTFCEVLAPSGLHRSAMHAAWGMAETTLMATSATGGIRVHSVARTTLEHEGRAVTSATGASDSRDVVCLGRPLVGADVRVRRSNGSALAGEDEVGEVEVWSTSLLTAYFEDDEATTAALADDGWLRTGDLGYLHDRELYLLGRSKDLVIVGARNIVPTDIEDVVARLAYARPGGVAAFGVNDGDTEGVVVVAEVRANDGTTERAIRDILVETLDVMPRKIVLVSRGTLPKTSSGKLMRAEIRERYLAGTLATGCSDAEDAGMV